MTLSLFHSITEPRSALRQFHRPHHRAINRSLSYVLDLPRDTYPGKNITIELLRNLPSYLTEIEKFTKRRIPENQEDKIYEYVNTHQIVKLNSSQTKKHRNDFYPDVKEYCRKSWEENTGRIWPTYETDLKINNKIVRKQGSKYDAHHIIENTYNGPHEWWNIHPAAFDEHHNLIHGNGSIAQKLFE